MNPENLIHHLKTDALYGLRDRLQTSVDLGAGPAVERALDLAETEIALREREQEFEAAEARCQGDR